MPELTVAQKKVKRFMDKKESIHANRERIKKENAKKNLGKRKINGQYYDEKAICPTKHAALKIEKEIKEESGNPTSVILTKAGWTVYAMIVS